MDYAHTCVRMCVRVCTQHTQSMCMHVTDLLLICQGMLIERGDRETYEPAISCFLTLVGIWLPRENKSPVWGIGSNFCNFVLGNILKGAFSVSKTNTFILLGIFSGKRKHINKNFFIHIYVYIVLNLFLLM